MNNWQVNLHLILTYYWHSTVIESGVNCIFPFSGSHSDFDRQQGSAGHFPNDDQVSGAWQQSAGMFRADWEPVMRSILDIIWFPTFVLGCWWDWPFQSSVWLRWMPRTRVLHHSTWSTSWRSCCTPPKKRSWILGPLGRLWIICTDSWRR